MTPLEERFHQLKTEVEDLKITTEENEIAYKKVKEFSDVIGKLNTEDEKGKEAYLKWVRNYLDTELEYLRSKNDLIRKVSPNISLLLEKKINEYDKSTREVLEAAFEKDLEKTSNSEAFLDFANLIKTIFYISTLQETVNIASETLLDTLDFLDGNRWLLRITKITTTLNSSKATDTLSL